jgi:hypothetical protein
MSQDRTLPPRKKPRCFDARMFSSTTALPVDRPGAAHKDGEK